MKIEFKTTNSAFCDPQTGEPGELWRVYETCKVLKNIIVRIQDGQKQGAVLDSNGNKIGEWEL